jgi:hypothetical protein
MLGGKVAPRLVLGGGMMLHLAMNRGLTVRGDIGNLYPKPPARMGLAIVGPMVDVFPFPSLGFHFGALAGVAGMNVRDSQNHVGGGAGAALWAGYMVKASSHWSLGALLRVSGAWTHHSVDDPVSGGKASLSNSSQTIALMFSAAYR